MPDDLEQKYEDSKTRSIVFNAIEKVKVLERANELLSGDRETPVDKTVHQEARQILIEEAEHYKDLANSLIEMVGQDLKQHGE